MATEKFSKAEFEQVLVQAKFVVHPVGLVGGEFRYRLAIRLGVNILVNSSIDSSGFAADTGDNSIRIWAADDNGKPLMGKTQAYVTRIRGWQDRTLKAIADTLKSISNIVAAPECPKCGKPMVKRNGSRGEFYGCSTYPKCNGTRNITATPSTVTSSNIPHIADAPILPTQPIKTFVPSKYQAAIFEWIKSAKSGSNAVVEAVAGSGKTTTCLQAFGLIPTTQEVIFICFNKRIAVANQAKIDNMGIRHAKMSTYHSLGYAAIRAAFGNPTVDDNKVDSILKSILDYDTQRHMFPAIRNLVELVKANLLTTSADNLDELCAHHGIELNGDREVVFQAVPAALKRSLELTSVIDYADMCYMPVALNLPMKQYDWVFVDEAQDTNRNQAELAINSVKPTGHIVAVGDRFQSLYGFRGADIDAIPNLIASLEAETLPLSISYRNPKCIVELVNTKRPEIKFEAADGAKEGQIRSITAEAALTEYAPGDMVLCRTNAPLVEPALALIRNGIKAVIIGRDISKGLLALVRKMKANSMNDLMSKLANYAKVEVAKLSAADKGNQAQALNDKVETVIALSSGMASIKELEDRINTIFAEEAEGVAFSSIHRAKGLEAERVYILHPELLPHPMARKPWEMVQEENIIYVAITRTLNELIWVN
jgi:DNA helicase-2/ATP-dependent DNA helicase PcrA